MADLSTMPPANKPAGDRYNNIDFQSFMEYSKELSK